MFHFSSPTKINVVNQALNTLEAFSQTTTGLFFMTVFFNVRNNQAHHEKYNAW